MEKTKQDRFTDLDIESYKLDIEIKKQQVALMKARVRIANAEADAIKKANK